MLGSRSSGKEHRRLPLGGALVVAIALFVLVSAPAQAADPE